MNQLQPKLLAEKDKKENFLKIIPKPNKQLPILFSERKLLLAFGDLAIINLVLAFLAQQYTSGFSLSIPGVIDRISWFITFSIVWLILGTLLNIYDLIQAADPIRAVWTSGSTALLSTSLYMLIPYLTPSLPDRRLYIFLFPFLTTSGVALWRLIYGTIFVQSTFQHKALVIGAGHAGRVLAQTLMESDVGNGRRRGQTGYQIIGFVDDDPEKQGLEISGRPVLGSGEDLIHLVKTWSPHELVVAMTNLQEMGPRLFQTILDCRELGIPVTTMANLYERITGRVPVEHAGRNLHVVLPVARPAGHRIYLFIRRFFDVVVALIGCALVLLLLPFVWLVNRLTCPGKTFFFQERTGEAGQTFRLIKFRSMVMDAERETGVVWAVEEDPRINLAGKFLRKTRLDELPQCWNILKGEMSLIGPRPERPHFITQLAQELPFYRARHAVKPGLTGWAQVKYRYGASTTDALVKLEYDLYYIKHQSAILDLEILIKTVQVMLGFKGR